MLGVYILISISASAISVAAPPASEGWLSTLLSILLGSLFSSLFLFMLLLPVALGLLVAERQSVEALLFAISGMTLFHEGLDVDYHFSFYSGNTPVVMFYNILWRFFVFVVAPMWMVRVRSDRGRLMGIALPILIASIFEVLVNNIGYPLATPAALSWSITVMLLQPMLAIGVAYMFYRHGGKEYDVMGKDDVGLALEPAK
jgi:hypothetical protein